MRQSTDEANRRAVVRTDIEGDDGNPDRLTENAMIRGDAEGYDRYRDELLANESLEQIAKEMEEGL